jgi:hypothetical protein
MFKMDYIRQVEILIIGKLNYLHQLHGKGFLRNDVEG